MTITIINGKEREETQKTIKHLQENGFIKQAALLKQRYSTNTTLPDEDCLISLRDDDIEVLRNRFGENTSHSLLKTIVDAHLNGEEIVWKQL